MVKSADTADLKSADPKGSWGFKSPSGHHGVNSLRSRKRPLNRWGTVPWKKRLDLGGVRQSSSSKAYRPSSACRMKFMRTRGTIASASSRSACRSNDSESVAGKRSGPRLRRPVSTDLSTGTSKSAERRPTRETPVEHGSARGGCLPLGGLAETLQRPHASEPTAFQRCSGASRRVADSRHCSHRKALATRLHYLSQV